MSIDRLTGMAGAGAPTQGNALDARALATSAIGELGHRVLAWVGATAPGGDAGSAAWSAATGSSSSFRPSGAELARRGDIYGIDQVASDIVGQMGGSPTQEGELRRALTDFTREAVVQAAGLSGAGALQVQGLSDALAAAGGEGQLTGVDGVVDRVEGATRLLQQHNGG